MHVAPLFAAALLVGSSMHLALGLDLPPAGGILDTLADTPKG